MGEQQVDDWFKATRQKRRQLELRAAHGLSEPAAGSAEQHTVEGAAAQELEKLQADLLKQVDTKMKENWQTLQKGRSWMVAWGGKPPSEAEKRQLEDLDWAPAEYTPPPQPEPARPVGSASMGSGSRRGKQKKAVTPAALMLSRRRETQQEEAAAAGWQTHDVLGLPGLPAVGGTRRQSVFSKTNLPGGRRQSVQQVLPFPLLRLRHANDPKLSVLIHTFTKFSISGLICWGYRARVDGGSRCMFPPMQTR